ncbi:MAG: hypothetical protein LBE17_11900 [Treponema sp.]|jgi:hypothetical protein|nr:hypothetical protein [Treponema sp.]
MYNFDDEKDTLVKMLSEKYSRNIITIEEYERILEYINKIETKKEINIIEKIILETVVDENELAAIKRNDAAASETKNHLSMFSWRTTTIKPINGNGGKFTSCFGANRIILEKLAKGKTILNVNTIFGLTEIIITQDIKIINEAVPVFSGIFVPNRTSGSDEDLPELCITGKAIFGNITVKSMEELNEEINQEKEFGEKYAEKLRQKMLDKISKRSRRIN